jgi:hypothetical protein
VLYKFLSATGMITPRRVSGLCARCQRRVAKTIKQSRHLGMIPHTIGIEIYQQIEVPEGNGPILAPAAKTGAEQDLPTRLKRLSAPTI